jgi:hypothetical protein
MVESTSMMTSMKKMNHTIAEPIDERLVFQKKNIVITKELDTNPVTGIIIMVDSYQVRSINASQRIILMQHTNLHQQNTEHHITEQAAKKLKSVLALNNVTV